jgi:hypothetical protein
MFAVILSIVSLRIVGPATAISELSPPFPDDQLHGPSWPKRERREEMYVPCGTMSVLASLRLSETTGSVTFEGKSTALKPGSA